MADTKESNPDAETPEGKGRRSKLLLVAAAVVLLGGGYAFTSASGGSAAEAAETEAVEEVLPGEVVPLSPITLNLADGRFLKVGLALQLPEGVTPPADAEVAGFAAPALDEAISMLGERTYADLVAPGGRDSAKAALSERVSVRYEGDVMGVYFTELVMQ